MDIDTDNQNKQRLGLPTGESALNHILGVVRTHCGGPAYRDDSKPRICDLCGEETPNWTLMFFRTPLFPKDRLRSITLCHDFNACKDRCETLLQARAFKESVQDGPDQPDD